MSLTAEIKRLGINCEALDDLVHDAASELASVMASEANNGGLGGQIEFLSKTCGWSDESIRSAMKELEPSAGPFP